MKFETCGFNVVFPEIKNIREKFFELESTLTDFAKPFNLISLPDEAPKEMPRILANTLHGHSSLSISCLSAQIMTKFDGDYTNNFELCSSYIFERANKLLEVIGRYTSNKYYFFGISTQINLEKANPVQLMCSQYVKANTFGDSQPYDAALKMTFVEEEIYYINMEIGNERRYNGIAANNNVSLYGLNEVGNELILTLDINNRYALNNRAEYFAEPEIIKKIIALTEKWAARVDVYKK